MTDFKRVALFSSIFFCKMTSSTYNKTETKNYINLLRRSSPNMGLIITCRNFQACKWHNKQNIYTVKNNRRKDIIIP